SLCGGGYLPDHLFLYWSYLRLSVGLWPTVPARHSDKADQGLPFDSTNCGSGQPVVTGTHQIRSTFDAPLARATRIDFAARSRTSTGVCRVKSRTGRG